MKNTQHNGFPIIRHTEANDEGQLVGSILRHQLLLLLEQRALIEVDSEMLQLPLPERFVARDPRVTKEHIYLEHAMRVYHHCHNPHRRYLSSRAEAVDDLDLDDILRVSIDMNHCAFQFPRMTCKKLLPVRNFLESYEEFSFLESILR